MNKRLHIDIPDQLVREIDNLVGEHCRGRFITEALRKKGRRARMLKALKDAGASRFIENLRKQSEKRLAVVTKR